MKPTAEDVARNLDAELELCGHTDGLKNPWDQLGECKRGRAAAIRRALHAEARGVELEVLLAWESGELSEGQACRLLGTDPVSARGMRTEAVAAARSRWAEWRASNPPSPG